MNTLDAVNEILSAIGEPPILELDTDGNTLEAEAETYLDRARRRVLVDGWGCNTLKKQLLLPDDSDHILMTDVLRYTPVDVDSYLRLTVRDGMLFDLDANTNEFSKPVYMDVSSLLSLIDIPGKLAIYIVKIAAFEFQRYIKRGAIEDNYLQDEVRKARLDARQENDDLYPVNLLNHRSVVQTMGYRKPRSTYGY